MGIKVEGKLFFLFIKISTRASLLFFGPIESTVFLFCLDGLKDVDVGSRGSQQNGDC